MIWRPYTGQRVRVHYNKRVAPIVPDHGARGHVLVVGRGPGPINAQIVFDDGTEAVVPRGNLVAETEENP